MKFKMFVLFVFAGLIAFGSCSDDEDGNNIPEKVKHAFAEKYPNAKDIEWKSKSGYSVAEFEIGDTDCFAWFDAEGVWYMTESETSYSTLPQEVKTAFEASEYKSWDKEDVAKLERNNYETYYCIEVERLLKNAHVCFAENGRFVVAVDGENNNHYAMLPKPVASEIQTIIDSEYSEAKIVNFENKTNAIEVNIIDDGIAKKLVFDLRKQWLQTSWKIHPTEAPTAIQSVISKNYVGWAVYNVDYVETSETSYYLYELTKKDNANKLVKIDTEGVVIP